MKNTTKLFILDLINSVLNGLMFGVGSIIAFALFYLVIKG